MSDKPGKTDIAKATETLLAAINTAAMAGSAMDARELKDLAHALTLVKGLLEGSDSDHDSKDTAKLLSLVDRLTP